MCLFDDDRGDTVRAARMGKCDAASGCGLAGYGQIGIADYGRTAGETDQPGHAKDADARSARLYAGAIGAGPIIRQTGDEKNAAAASPLASRAISDRAGEGGCSWRRNRVKPVGRDGRLSVRTGADRKSKRLNSSPQCAHQIT